MNENKKKKSVFRIIWLILGIIIIASFIACIVLEAVNPELPLSIWMKDNVWDVKKTLASLNTHTGTIIHCVIYIVVIYSICSILRLIFKKQMEKSNRTKTVITLLDGLVKYGCAIALIILVLKACGVNTTALWASVGVLTLVIGLGCQSLIADIVAGMFIIFENEYNVGEIVAISGFRGVVTEIGIRSTRLLDDAGNIKIINNSDISDIVNLSRELSLAVVECEFPYDVPLEFVENLIKDNLETMKEKIPAIIEGPFYKGVTAYYDSNVAVKLVARCHESNRYQVQRDLLREYRILFVKNGFDLSFQQVVINEAKPSEISVSKSEVKEANAFVQDQKEQSAGMDSQQN